MLNKINPCNFTWQLWRGGTLYDLGVKRYRKEFIIEKTISLRKHAIGYCKGVSLICRPKRDYYAVMFQKNNIQFWTHLTTEEFEHIFNGVR